MMFFIDLKDMLETISDFNLTILWPNAQVKHVPRLNALFLLAHTASTPRISRKTNAPIVVNAEKLWNRLTSSTALLCRSLRNSGHCSCTRSCLLCRGPLCQSMPTGVWDSSLLLLCSTACSCSLCTSSGGFCLRLQAC
jgi:hypothetical protein